jgi:hypothetical protein
MGNIGRVLISAVLLLAACGDGALQSPFPVVDAGPPRDLARRIVTVDLTPIWDVGPDLARAPAVPVPEVKPDLAQATAVDLALALSMPDLAPSPVPDLARCGYVGEPPCQVGALWLCYDDSVPMQQGDFCSSPIDRRCMPVTSSCGTFALPCCPYAGAPSSAGYCRLPDSLNAGCRCSYGTCKLCQ